MPPEPAQSRRVPDPVAVYVGRKLREIRLDRGLTCTWVARHAGMSIGTYNRVEQGYRIGLDRLVAILAVLGAEFEDAWPPADWVHPTWPTAT